MYLKTTLTGSRQKQDETKRSLEKEANSKIMAINEYSDTVLDEDVDFTFDDFDILDKFGKPVAFAN